ncbi:MAG: hypothetical protein ACK2TV_01470 [Anaerolineales bacterium]
MKFTGKMNTMRNQKWFLFLFLALIGLSSCTYIPDQYRTINAEPLQETLSVSYPVKNPTSSPIPANEAPLITPEPTPTAEPIQLTATVWQQAPRAPILMYHRFNPLPGGVSYQYTTSLSDFDGHLQALYDAGFALVPLSDWLQGAIHVPEGRRPLVLTLDDLYYGDQLILDEEGNPASYCGVGRLWRFSQDHPGFNFDVALFYNLGDKAYANQYANGVFSVQDGWREDQAKAIAWGIQNGAIPLNHFYKHPFLDQLNPDQILWQLQENDAALRNALDLIGARDLAARLPNILALPYVVWPATDAGKQVLYDYISPEGAPVMGIVEGGYATSSKLCPAPFNPEFDPHHIPRLNVTWDAINLIVSLKEDLPTAAKCDLGIFTKEALYNDPSQISNAISDLTQSGNCPEGYYVVEGLVFSVFNGEVIQQ